MQRFPLTFPIAAIKHFPERSAVQLVLFIGIQATGKSSFYLNRFYRTHMRINLDMLRTRHRERILFQACLTALQPLVVDNTNLTREERALYITAAKEARFKVTGYFFQSRTSEALSRNASRPEPERVPDKAILGASGRLQSPSLDEGFDELFFVRLAEDNQFMQEPWKNEL